MTRFTRSLVATLAATVATTLALTACSSGGGGDNPLDSGGSGSGVVVGSANFPENVLLAELYAEALGNAGAQVERRFNIGSREIYFDQLQSGAISLLPEYNGALLARVAPDADATTTDDVNSALRDTLPDSLAILDSAPAQNKDSLAVTSALAQEHSLRTIEDLAPIASTLTIGAAPEFEDRRQGLVGLQDVYGLRFREFRPTDNSGPVTLAGLKDGTIQVGDVYTTDPSLAGDELVGLEDTKGVFGAQNVTPLVHSGALTDDQIAAVNAVSAKLTTEELVRLVGLVVTDGRDIDAVAQQWLADQGLT